jgi:ribonuclease HI
MEEIHVYCDGSSLGNPGPGGWAWWASDTSWKAEAYAHGVTNNQMELQALLDLLERAPKEAPLKIHLDSRYVLDAVTKWSYNWRRNNWMKKDGTPVANREQIEAILNLLPGRKITWQWVRGHVGVYGNEQADLKAHQGATRAQKTGEPNQSGPGWN